LENFSSAENGERIQILDEIFRKEIQPVQAVQG